MPISESAKKRVRQDEKKRERNKKKRSYVRTTQRLFEDAVEAGDVELARERLREAESAWDRAASKGVIPKKRASRKVSRMKKRFSKLENEES